MTAASSGWTLYDLEEHLVALVDSMETVTPDQEQEFMEDFKAALSSAAEKRDRVAHLLAHLEQQQAFAAQEIARLQKFKKDRQAVQARLEAYVSYCIQSLGLDQSGKYRKLEGNTTVMFLRSCPPSVEVTDLDAVPADYKSVAITLPALVWDAILRALEDELADKVATTVARAETRTVDKRAVNTAINSGILVPGARLITGLTSLGRR
jgi:hypothetical protein